MGVINLKFISEGFHEDYLDCGAKHTGGLWNCSYNFYNKSLLDFLPCMCLFHHVMFLITCAATD